MFTLTRKTDYALIALCHMARRADSVCTAREIGERFHVPLPLLMNILKTLNQSGLIRSIRGARGGYRISRSPERITLDQIIASVEGPVRFVQCAGDHSHGEVDCDLLSTCPVSRPVRKVHDRLNEFLGQVTLEQIAFDKDYGDHAVLLTVKGAAPWPRPALTTGNE